MYGVVHSNRVLLKEERNCNTSEYLSVCICNQMHYGGYMLYYFQDLDGQVKTSSQDIVHLSLCRIVFVYVFFLHKGPSIEP